MNDPDDSDMLAAEYVLGTLDAAERAGVSARLGADVELLRAIHAWEERFSPLLHGVPDVAPPVEAYAAIAARIFGSVRPSISAGHDGAVTALRRRLRRWQGATAGLALLAASLLAWVAVRESSSSAYAGRRFTAVLQRESGAPTMVVDVDLAARRLSVRPIAAAAPVGSVYELWIIDPALGAPRSLGVVPGSGDARGSLAPFDASVIAGATYAVTVEAPGGSATGRPTTAPVLSGKLSPFPS